MLNNNSVKKTVTHEITGLDIKFKKAKPWIPDSWFGLLKNVVCVKG